MSKNFITETFLLQNEFARRLYFDHAEQLPIIDYHNHLIPSQIANNHQFENITQAWLYGDHYKWRAMRANGIDEDDITGSSSDEVKFERWAATVPFTVRNPLFHWTHLELERYFGINDLLSSENASSVYARMGEMLRHSENSVLGLLSKMKVETVCTTDDPADDLGHHKSFAKSDSELKMLPGFRPDRFILIEKNNFPESLSHLSEISGIEIVNFSDLLAALMQRIDHFHMHGCRISDHGLTHIPSVDWKSMDIEKIWRHKLSGEKISITEVNSFKRYVLNFLAEAYHDKGWVMQFHLGAIRNNSGRLERILGSDVGADSIGDYPQAVGLADFLNHLDSKGKLPKTILYNLNPADNEMFATMTGNFNDGSVKGKIQWGSAWWFLDQKDGMEAQMNILSNMGLLSHFIGMLTDSRSFLSFPRHEYFRRILCNLLGNDVESGMLPNDISFLGQMVENICYYNAKSYFPFE